MINFLKNIWLFRKSLWNYRWYAGHDAVFGLFKNAIDDIGHKLKTKGHEEETSRMKKVCQIERLSILLSHLLKDDYIEIAEKQLGYTLNHNCKFVPLKTGNYQYVSENTEEESIKNKRIIDLSQKLQKEHWEEICQIIKGPDYESFKNSNQEWNQWYDGTDIRAWWD